MTHKPASLHTRSPEQIREHYEIEKELAAKLRGANWEERRKLYSPIYDELLRRVPHHPMLVRKASVADTTKAVNRQVTYLAPYLNDDTTFLEVGPGDCALSLALTKHVKQVYAVDVSSEITKGSATPANFKLFISDGRTIPVPSSTVNVAYSNQLMEHLHPDDALEQLRGIYGALAPNGMYFCITPNKLTGPHDISRSFDPVATGFHLKEYTVSELRSLFLKVGFSKVILVVGVKGRHFRSSSRLTIMLEKLLISLPLPIANSKLFGRLMRKLLGIRMIGIK